jgi:hypothetical protein
MTGVASTAIYLDVTESFEQVLERFQKFQQADFDTEYARFLKTQQRLQTQYRFRHHPRRCLTALENQWAEAIRRKAPRCQGSRHREQFISEKAQFANFERKKFNRLGANIHRRG